MGVDPVSMAMMGMTAASGAIKAGSALAGGKAAQNAMNYKAQVARNNAEIADQSARWTEEAGMAKEGAQGLKNRQVVGGIKTSQAASGVDIDVGSSPAVREASAALGVLDQETIRSNTAREAYGYRVQGQSERAQAELDTMAGQEARRASKVRAITSLLDSASSVGGKYASWQRGAPTGAGTRLSASQTVESNNLEW